MTIGESIPLHMIGRTSGVTAMGIDGGSLFGSDRDRGCLADVGLRRGGPFGADSDRKGSMGRRDRPHPTLRGHLASELAPLYQPALPEGDLVPQLALAARLINADLGIRVLNASFGSFDTHDAEATRTPSSSASSTTPSRCSTPRCIRTWPTRSRS